MVETFFTEKGIIKKIIIVLVFIFMFNFTFSYLGNDVVLATEGEAMTDEEIEEGGGKLLLPIHNLILFVSDAVLELMQNSFISSDPVTIKAYSKDVSQVNGWSIAGIVIGVVVLAVACVVTYGAAAAAVGSVTTAVAGTTGAAAIGTAATAIGTAASTYGGTVVGGLIFAGGSIAGIAYSTDKFIDDIKGEFDLPTIQYTPEAIFSNRIPLFNINFFNPNEGTYEIKNIERKEETIVNATYPNQEIKLLKEVSAQSEYCNTSENAYNNRNKMVQEYTEQANVSLKLFKEYQKILKEMSNNKELKGNSSVKQAYIDITGGSLSNINLSRDIINEALMAIQMNTSYPNATDYAKAINIQVKRINEEIKLFIDTFNKVWNNLDKEAKEYMGEHYKTSFNNETKTNTSTKENIVATYESSSKILQKTVASMYKTLRTVAIVALLSILVYVGIRMVISSTSKDKAKYKQMLMDWLVAFIMLFVLHYIMAFIIDISENLTEICNKSNVENVPIAIPNGTKVQDQEGNLERLDGEDDSKKDVWSTNFIGSIRFYAGLVQKKGYTIKGISYTLMYVVLVIYIVMFTFQYMKRVLYMAFLTMISPLVAITYPLDKISDGKAQGFSMWLKEYIFNALLQPIHYVIYVIIMGSVMEMVINHPIYALVALGFMVPAEKFIRKMFGFEKASTVGAFGGAAGAAMLMSGVQRLTHRPHKKDNDDNGAKGNQDNPNGKIKTISSIPEGPGGNNGKTNGGGNTPIGGGTDDSGIIPGTNPPRITGGLADGNENNNSQWHSRLSQEQRDELNAEGIMPGDAEYDNALRNYGIDPNKPDWDPRLTPEQIDYARENDIYEPKGQEYEQFLGQLGYGTKPSVETAAIEPTSTPASTTPNQSQIKGTKQYNKPIGPEPYQKPNLFNRARTGLSKVSNSSFGQGVKAVGGHYTRRLENKLRKSHPLRSLRRGITYAAGAATLGTIGLAAGIASGDPSKALQYTMAGGIAGGNLGKNLGETASNIVGLEGTAKSFKAGALGEKYNDIEREKYKRNFKRNVSNYDAGVRNVTAKGWREMSKNGGIIDTALDYGINNIDDMSNIYRAQQRFMTKGYNEEEAMKNAFAGYDLDKNFGDYDTNDKTREKLDKLLKDNGYTDDEQRELVKKGMLSTMNEYQAATLGKTGNETEVETETPPDYVRIANNSQSNEATEAINTPQVRENNHMTDKEPEEERDDREIQQPPTIPINQVPQENQEEIAKRANAESEANKAQMKQESRNREIEEQLQKTQKQAKKKERKDRAEKSKTKNKEAKAKRNKIKEENNVFDGEQGTSVKELKTGRNRKSNGSETTLDNSEPIKTVDKTFTGDTPIQSPPKK